MSPETFRSAFSVHVSKRIPTPTFCPRKKAFKSNSSRSEICCQFASEIPKGEFNFPPNTANIKSSSLLLQPDLQTKSLSEMK